VCKNTHTHIHALLFPRAYLQGWATLFLANCALAFNVFDLASNRPLLLTLLLLLLMGALFVLAGMWLTLQFRWIQVTGGPKRAVPPSRAPRDEARSSGQAHTSGIAWCPWPAWTPQPRNRGGC
jgi:hypothetical protein